MKPNMRTTGDRLRHTLLFEVLLIMICVPTLSILLDKPMHTTGGLSLTVSLTAMTLNYIYNYLFDHALVRLGKPLYPRGRRLRMFHSVFFELFLFVFTAPMIMYALDYTFIQAVIFDIGFIIAVPIYAYIFNVTYDRIFPVPQTAQSR